MRLAVVCQSGVRDRDVWRFVMKLKRGDVLVAVETRNCSRAPARAYGCTFSSTAGPGISIVLEDADRVDSEELHASAAVREADELHAFLDGPDHRAEASVIRAFVSAGKRVLVHYPEGQVVEWRGDLTL